MRRISPLGLEPLELTFSFWQLSEVVPFFLESVRGLPFSPFPFPGETGSSSFGPTNLSLVGDALKRFEIVFLRRAPSLPSLGL